MAEDKTPNETFVRHQKELEERVEEIQSLLENETVSHQKDNLKYKKAFHALIKDISKIDRITSSYRLILEENPSDETLTIDRVDVLVMLSILSKFHDKYKDKSFAYLTEIITNE